MKKTAVILIIVMLLTLTASCKRQVVEDETATILSGTETTEQVTSDSPSDISENKSPEPAERENTETVDTSDKIETTVEEKIVTNSPKKENTTENIEEKVSIDIENEPQTTPENESSDNGNKDIEAIVSGILPTITVSDMIDQASLIAVCEYVAPIDVIRVLGRNFTNHKMKVTEVLRGEETKEEITVRAEGGRAGGYNFIYEDGVEFSTGDKYLLFLYNPGTDDPYNTEGDHYFIVGVSQGAMRLIDERDHHYEMLKIDGEAYASGSRASFKVSLESSLDTAAFDSVIVLDGFRSILAKMNETVPINYNYVREQRLINAKANYENGVISKEKYDEILEGSREYAPITDRVPFTAK